METATTALAGAPAQSVSPVAARGRARERTLVVGRALTVSFGGRRVLDRIDITVKAREIVTLIGPNGAGKSTLVRVLLGLVRPDQGDVRRREGLRVGYVPQRLELDDAIPLSVARFLTLGGWRARGEIEQVLREVGAGHAIDRQVRALSGGELQRVALARALLRNPELLVLDEPARGVDHVGEAELYALIARLRDARGLGVLLVSHDLHVVMASSDRVICVNGHICCSGKPSSVAQDPAYQQLFGLEGARNVAIYSHHHDHRHDPETGDCLPVTGAGGGEEQGGEMVNPAAAAQQRAPRPDGDHGHDDDHAHGHSHGHAHPSGKVDRS